MRASDREGQEVEGVEVWKRRQSLQACGGMTQTQRVCMARESPNGTAGAEREAGKMQQQYLFDNHHFP